MSRTSRCYNCGLPGHQTQACPSYGPRYPAPGKTSQDYDEQLEKIRGLIAADIINEHNQDQSEDVDYERTADLQREDRRRNRRTAGAGEAGQAEEDGDSPSDSGPVRHQPELAD